MPKRCDLSDDEAPRKRKKPNYDPDRPIAELIDDFTTYRKRNTDKGRSYPAEEICPQLATVALSLPPLWLSCGQPPKRARLVGAHDADAHNLLVCCTCQWCLSTIATGDTGSSRGGRRQGAGAGAGAENLPFRGRLFNLPQWHEHATETRVTGIDLDKQADSVRHLLFNIVRVVQVTQAEGDGPSSEQQQPQPTLWEFLFSRNLAEARSVAASAAPDHVSSPADDVAAAGAAAVAAGSGTAARGGGQRAGAPSPTLLSCLQGLRVHVFYHEELPAGRWYTGTIIEAGEMSPALKVRWDAWEYEPTGAHMPVTYGEVLLGVTLLHFGPQPPSPGGDGAGPAHRIRSLPSRSLTAMAAEQGPGPSHAPASSPQWRAALPAGAQPQHGGVVGSQPGGHDACGDGPVPGEGAGAEGGSADKTKGTVALPQPQIACPRLRDRCAEQHVAKSEPDEALASSGGAAGPGPGGSAPSNQIGAPLRKAPAPPTAGKASGRPLTSGQDAPGSGKEPPPGGVAAEPMRATAPQDSRAKGLAQPEPPGVRDSKPQLRPRPGNAPPTPLPQAAAPAQQQQHAKQRDRTGKRTQPPQAHRELHPSIRAPHPGTGALPADRIVAGQAPPPAITDPQRQAKRQRSYPAQGALDALRMPPPAPPVAQGEQAVQQQHFRRPCGAEAWVRQPGPAVQRPGYQPPPPPLGPPGQPGQQLEQQTGPVVGSEDQSMATIDLAILLAHRRGLRPSSPGLEAEGEGDPARSLGAAREAAADAGCAAGDVQSPADAGRDDGEGGAAGIPPDETAGDAFSPGANGDGYGQREEGTVLCVDGAGAAPGRGGDDDGTASALAAAAGQYETTGGCNAQSAAYVGTGTTAGAPTGHEPAPGPTSLLPDFVLPFESEPQGRLQLPAPQQLKVEDLGGWPDEPRQQQFPAGGRHQSLAQDARGRPFTEFVSLPVRLEAAEPQPGVLVGESQQAQLDLVLSQRDAAPICKADGEVTAAVGAARAQGHTAGLGTGDVVVTSEGQAAAGTGSRADGPGDARAAAAAGAVAPAAAGTNAVGVEGAGSQRDAADSGEGGARVSAAEAVAVDGGNQAAAAAAEGAQTQSRLSAAMPGASELAAAVATLEAAKSVGPLAAATTARADAPTVNGKERGILCSQQGGSVVAADGAAQGACRAPEAEVEPLELRIPRAGPRERHSSESDGTISSLGRPAPQPPGGHGPAHPLHRSSTSLARSWLRAGVAEGDEVEWQGGWLTASGQGPDGAGAAAGAGGSGHRQEPAGIGLSCDSSDGDLEERDGDGGGAVAGVQRLLAAMDSGGGSGSGSATTSGCSAGPRQGDNAGAAGPATVSNRQTAADSQLLAGGMLPLPELPRPEAGLQHQQQPPSSDGYASAAAASKQPPGPASRGASAVAAGGDAAAAGYSTAARRGDRLASGSATAGTEAVAVHATGAPAGMAAPAAAASSRMPSLTPSPHPRAGRQQLVVLGAPGGSPPGAVPAAGRDAYDLPTEEEEAGGGDEASSSYRTAQEEDGNGEGSGGANEPGSTARGGAEPRGDSPPGGTPVPAASAGQAGAEQAPTERQLQPLAPRQELDQGQPPAAPALLEGGGSEVQRTPPSDPLAATFVALASTHRSRTAAAPVALNLWYAFAEDGGGSGSGEDAAAIAGSPAPVRAGPGPSSATNQASEQPPPPPPPAAPLVRHDKERQQQQRPEEQQQQRELTRCGAQARRGGSEARGPGGSEMAVVEGAGNGGAGDRPSEGQPEGPSVRQGPHGAAALTGGRLTMDGVAAAAAAAATAQPAVCGGVCVKRNNTAPRTDNYPSLLLPPPPWPAADDATAAARGALEVAERIAQSVPLTSQAGVGDGAPGRQARLHVQLCHAAHPVNRIVTSQQFRALEASLQQLLAAADSGGGADGGALYVSGPQPQPRTSGTMDRNLVVQLPHLLQLDYCLHLQASGGAGEQDAGGGHRPSSLGQGNGGPRPGGGLFGVFGAVTSATRAPTGSVQMCTTYGMRIQWTRPQAGGGAAADRPMGQEQFGLELEVQIQLHSCTIQGAVGLKEVGLVLEVRDSVQGGGLGAPDGVQSRCREAWGARASGDWGWDAVVALAVWLGSGICQVAALPPRPSQAEEGAVLLRQLLNKRALGRALGLGVGPPPQRAGAAVAQEPAADLRAGNASGVAGTGRDVGTGLTDGAVRGAEVSTLSAAAAEAEAPAVRAAAEAEAPAVRAAAEEAAPQSHDGYKGPRATATLQPEPQQGGACGSAGAGGAGAEEVGVGLEEGAAPAAIDRSGGSGCLDGGGDGEAPDGEDVIRAFAGDAQTAAAGPTPTPAEAEAAETQVAEALAGDAAAAEELSVRERALLVDPLLLTTWEEFGLLADLKPLLRVLTAEELGKSPVRLVARLLELALGAGSDSTARPGRSAETAPAGTAGSAAATTAAAAAAKTAAAAASTSGSSAALSGQHRPPRPPPVDAAPMSFPAAALFAAARSAALLVVATYFDWARLEAVAGSPDSQDCGASGAAAAPSLSPAAAAGAPPTTAEPLGAEVGAGLGPCTASQPGHGGQLPQQRRRDQEDLGAMLRWLLELYWAARRVHRTEEYWQVLCRVKALLRVGLVVDGRPLAHKHGPMAKLLQSAITSVFTKPWPAEANIAGTGDSDTGRLRACWNEILEARWQKREQEAAEAAEVAPQAQAPAQAPTAVLQPSQAPLQLQALRQQALQHLQHLAQAQQLQLQQRQQLRTLHQQSQQQQMLQRLWPPTQSTRQQTTQRPRQQPQQRRAALSEPGAPAAHLQPQQLQPQRKRRRPAPQQPQAPPTTQLQHAQPAPHAQPARRSSQSAPALQHQHQHQSYDVVAHLQEYARQLAGLPQQLLRTQRDAILQLYAVALSRGTTQQDAEQPLPQEQQQLQQQLVGIRVLGWQPGAEVFADGTRNFVMRFEYVGLQLTQEYCVKPHEVEGLQQSVGQERELSMGEVIVAVAAALRRTGMVLPAPVEQAIAVRGGPLHLQFLTELLRYWQSQQLLMLQSYRQPQLQPAAGTHAAAAQAPTAAAAVGHAGATMAQRASLSSAPVGQLSAVPALQASPALATAASSAVSAAAPGAPPLSPATMKAAGPDAGRGANPTLASAAALAGARRALTGRRAPAPATEAALLLTGQQQQQQQPVVLPAAARQAGAAATPSAPFARSYAPAASGGALVAGAIGEQFAPAAVAGEAGQGGQPLSVRMGQPAAMATGTPGGGAAVAHQLPPQPQQATQAAAAAAAAVGQRVQAQCPAAVAMQQQQQQQHLLLHQLRLSNQLQQWQLQQQQLPPPQQQQMQQQMQQLQYLVAQGGQRGVMPAALQSAPQMVSGARGPTSGAMLPTTTVPAAIQRTAHPTVTDPAFPSQGAGQPAAMPLAAAGGAGNAHGAPGAVRGPTGTSAFSTLGDIWDSL